MNNYYYQEELHCALSSLNVSAESMGPDLLSVIKKDLSFKYGIDFNDTSVTTSNVTEIESIHNSDAWERISEFIGDERCILFFVERIDNSAWLFNNGFDLVKTLHKTVGFVFFVTSEFSDYLIAYNDHDCLIGFGRATEWAKSLEDTTKKGGMD